MDPTRAFVKDVKRVIIKVGTAVATRDDGRLALGRLGALCEQVKELNSQGYEVILVTSGAVGVGHQRLQSRKLVNNSFADLQNPQVELDGKACAAVGQNGLMSLYDTMFNQLDITSSQMLVTDNDFKDPDFRMQLSQAVNSLLSLRVIPVFNENDAISTKSIPYKDSSGIFWDNDSLSALLALELKADLLILLNDVEGLYSGPPSDPKSKLIHTCIEEKHQKKVTFGDKSTVGIGLTAKVKAAVYAASAGTPVAIVGYTDDDIIKVLRGECVGTLFHKNAHLWVTNKILTAHEMAVSARECSRRIQALSSQDRRKILLDIADALQANEDLIRVENEADVAATQQAGYAKSLVSRLTLKPGKIASLAIQSGNGLLLKGGKEAARSNAILHKLDDVIDLVIPRGSNKLVSQIKELTKIPVLGHSDGICHVYVDKSANINMAKRVILDAKETLLVHKHLSETGDLDELCLEFKNEGVTLSGRPRASAALDIPAAVSFHHEYNSMDCTVEIVDDVFEAINHIHRHASAAVFHNASTRFCNGSRFELGDEVGVSTSRIHARRPVGVEGLLTTRWLLRGCGQVVGGVKGIVYS